MAKKSAIEKNKRRRKLAEHYRKKREALRAVVRDKDAPPDERFQATVMLAKLPRNSAPNRIRNRCELTGRPRAYYRKFGLSRVALRECGLRGALPGVVKSSW